MTMDIFGVERMPSARGNQGKSDINENGIQGALPRIGMGIEPDIKTRGRRRTGEDTGAVHAERGRRE